jgi:endoglucanase
MRSLTTLCLCAAGCAAFRPGAADPAAGADDDSCAARSLLEDAEDGDDRVRLGGYLYTYADELGTRVLPGGDEPPVARGGASGSRGALHLVATLAEADGAFAGVGFSLTEPKRAYDASSWTGVSFWARRAPGSATTTLRLKLPDAATDPDGGVCRDCYNDFGIDVPLEDDWRHYTAAFADLRQEGGWGDPRPDGIDATRLYGLQWHATGHGGPVDVWIDDVRFLGCD